MSRLFLMQCALQVHARVLVKMDIQVVVTWRLKVVLLQKTAYFADCKSRIVVV